MAQYIKQNELPENRVTNPMHQAGVRYDTLLNLVKQFKGELGSGVLIKKPDHQRRYVWSKDKERGWHEDILKGYLAPNMIILYFTFANASTLYINDGLQRLTAAMILYDNPEKYGVSKDEICKLMSTCLVAIWTQHYESSVQIVEDFAKGQLQTQCTAYEQCYGLIVCMSDYHLVYKEELDRLRSAVESNVVLLSNNAISDERKFRHKCYRNDFGLFLRLVLNIKETKNFMTNKSVVSYKDIKRSSYVEATLKDYLQSAGQAKIRQDITNFKKFIKEVAGLIKSEWHKTRRDDDKPGISETLIRNLFDVAIWCQANNISLNLDYRRFVSSVLDLTRGDPQCPKPKSHKAFIFKIDGVSQLRDVARTFNLDLFLSGSHTRTSQRSSGVHHNGHLPLSHFNGGKDIKPQDPFENRALGKNNGPEMK